MNISTKITFEEAIDITQELLSKHLSQEEIYEQIAGLVSSENGARGFFVVYLTGDDTGADNPGDGVVKALQSSPEIVAELLVKNLAMSTAMAITHERNQDTDNATGSQQVSTRSSNLIEKLHLDLIKDKLQAMIDSATNGVGIYQQFLERWGYDEEQKQAIIKVISQLRI